MTKIVLLSFLILGFTLSSCEGCSRSGRQNRSTKSSRGDNSHTTRGKLIIPMVKKNGVYEIPVQINGSNMNFIFDTGASDITISTVEARFLVKQGTLSREDVLGTEQYQIADGSITEGMVINLKSIQIGSRIIYNVKASIVNNAEAPLLFGQTALSEFGKISIDYNRNEIIFE